MVWLRNVVIKYLMMNVCVCVCVCVRTAVCSIVCAACMFMVNVLANQQPPSDFHVAQLKIPLSRTCPNVSSSER